MRATLSRRDQQRLNCIRDSRRTAHKFSSRRRAILLLNTFSRVPVIRRILNATSPSILLYFSPFQRFTALGVLLVSARATRVTLFIAPDSFLFLFSFPFFFFLLHARHGFIRRIHIGENHKSALRNRVSGRDGCQSFRDRRCILFSVDFKKIFLWYSSRARQEFLRRSSFLNFACNLDKLVV